jgi:hypothetical protein
MLDAGKIPFPIPRLPRLAGLLFHPATKKPDVMETQESRTNHFSRQGKHMITQLLAEGAPETSQRFACEQERLEAQVLRRVGGRVRDLRVLVRHNGVILNGRCATYHAKQIAQHTAMELTGLPILANDIEVR